MTRTAAASNRLLFGVLVLDVSDAFAPVRMYSNRSSSLMRSNRSVRRSGSGEISRQALRRNSGPVTLPHVCAFGRMRDARLARRSSYNVFSHWMTSSMYRLGPGMISAWLEGVTDARVAPGVAVESRQSCAIGSLDFWRRGQMKEVAMPTIR